MTDVVKDVETAASGVTSVETVAADAAKAATGLASGLLTGLMPYVLGVLGAIILGLAATVAFDHYVTIPHYQAQAELATAALASANAATTQCNASQEALRATVTDQNAKIAALQADADARAAAAGKAADQALHAPPRPLPKPPAGQSAAAINDYWTHLQGAAP